MSPLLELTKWRVREFLRQPEAIFWVFAFPLLLAVALGVAFRNRGAPTVQVAVERGEGADAIVAAVARQPRLRVEVLDSSDAFRALRTGRVPLVVVPADPPVLRFDSTREESLVARLLVHDALQTAAGRSDPTTILEIHSAEPGARYIDFLVPGLLGMNIMGTGFWGVGFGIVQTRTRKLLKRLVASPMRRSHFLLGQMLARMVFLFLEAFALIAFGVLVFGVPFQGHWLTFTVVVMLGGLMFAGMGALIGSRVRTVEGASGLMNLAMMPMWILSGVFFSASNFPDLVQPVIRALPLTSLNDALRAVMLDGAPLFALGPLLLAMALWTVAAFGIALRIFRWS